MSSVMEGMEASDGIVARMDDAVYKCDSALAKKQREIHDEWEALVFDKIQRQIKRHVDGLDAEELSLESAARQRDVHDDGAGEAARTSQSRGVPRRGSRVRLRSVRVPEARVQVPDQLAGRSDETGRAQTAQGGDRGWTAGRGARDGRRAPGDARVQILEQSRVHAPRSVHRRAGALLPPDADIPGFFKQGEDKWNRHSEANRRDDYEYPIGNEHAQREYFEASRGARVAVASTRWTATRGTCATW